MDLGSKIFFLSATIFFITLNIIAFKKKVSRKLSAIILASFISILAIISIVTFLTPHSTGEDFAAGLLITFMIAVLLLTPYLLPIFVFSFLKNKALFVLTLLPGSIIVYIIIRARLIGAL